MPLQAYVKLLCKSLMTANYLISFLSNLSWGKKNVNIAEATIEIMKEFFRKTLLPFYFALHSNFTVK